MLASSYPLLDVFWTMLWFFCFFIWIYLLIVVFADIFRSEDLSGGAKALWTIFVLFLPLLGVLVYMIARGGSMQRRQARQTADAKKQMDSYIRATAGSTSTATELTKLAQLRDAGDISEAEFAQAKSQLLTGTEASVGSVPSNGHSRDEATTGDHQPA